MTVEVVVVNKLKIIGAYLLTLLLTIATLGGYAYRQKRKADESERENQRLMIENQGLVEHGQRIQDAATQNAKQRATIEREIADGKRDYFERGY